MGIKCSINLIPETFVSNFISLSLFLCRSDTAIVKLIPFSIRIIVNVEICEGKNHCWFIVFEIYLMNEICITISSSNSKIFSMTISGIETLARLDREREKKIVTKNSIECVEREGKSRWNLKNGKEKQRNGRELDWNRRSWTSKYLRFDFVSLFYFLRIIITWFSKESNQARCHRHRCVAIKKEKGEKF